MAVNDGYLRAVPSDADPDDGRLYDPTSPDVAAGDFVPSWARGVLVGLALAWVPAAALPQRPVTIAAVLEVVADAPVGTRNPAALDQWAVSWSAQRSATIAPLTLPRGDEPPTIGATVPFGVGEQWVAQWPAQRGAVVATLTLPRGDEPPRARLVSLADRWTTGWAAQRGVSTTPFDIVVETPAGRGMPAALDRWTVLWAAQRPVAFAPLVVPIVDGVPAGQRVSFADRWGTSWSAQRGAVIAPLLGGTGEIVPDVLVWPDATAISFRRVFYRARLYR